MNGVFKTVAYAVFNRIGVGCANATKRSELAASFGDRDARRAIEELRVNYPILNLSDGKGYFIPEFTPEGIKQAEEYKKMQLARVNSIHKSLRGVNKFLRESKKKTQVHGQIEMFGGKL